MHCLAGAASANHPRSVRHRIIFALFLAQIVIYQTVTAAIEPRPGSSTSSSSRRDKGKKKWGAGPSPGFTGGQTLDNNNVIWCESPSLPGCQACADGTRCTACWEAFPNATGSSFVLNRVTGQCDCPPGYGLWPTLPPPTWPGPSRHLLAQLPSLPVEQELGLSAAAADADEVAWPVSGLGKAPEATAVTADSHLAVTSEAPQLKAALAAVNVTELAELQDVKPGLWLPDPLPEWASNCMPCPVNYYSPGGQQGFAQCQPCPGVFTTAGATASANCLFPNCGPGQEPTRRLGRCRACPRGTYSSATANNQPCYTCPKGLTTAATGSRTFADCRVPVCAPGQELDLDLLVCYGCKGNTVSPGGKVSQGTMQPRCEECPWGTAANETHQVCYTGACPYPDSFRITCEKDNLLGATSYPLCGPNAKASSVNLYCTAYPPGSVLAWYEPRTFTTNERVTQETSCPAGANSSSTKYPAIVSFNGRTDCFCSSTSCYFEGAGVLTTTTATGVLGAARILVRNINVTIPDPQDASLKALVRSMAGSNSTVAYTALSAGYCRRQQLVITESELLELGQTPPNPTGQIFPLRNWTNPLQVNCSGQYITRIALQPPNVTTLEQQRNFGTWTNDGRLPDARFLKGLSQLQMLTCVECGLDGTLPRDWGTQDSLMNLRDLNLPGNEFTGTLPETWGYMVNLQRLTLSSKSSATMGLIPSAWGRMRSLVFVNMTGLYLDNGASSCAPWEWQWVNGLVWGDTLLPPANFPTMDFCVAPEQPSVNG